MIYGASDDPKYGILCPNCNKIAAWQFSQQGPIDLFIVCAHCGLHLYCAKKQWVPTRSYIDESIIKTKADRIIDELDPELEDSFFKKEILNIGNSDRDDSVVIEPLDLLGEQLL